jgi:hypothetical protein
MFTTLVNVEEAPNKWWANYDARMKNLTNKTHYTQDVQVQVERMKLVLPMVYSTTRVYESYGKRGVSIKVENAHIADRKNLKVLESEWSKMGFVKKVTPQGIIYRLSI